VRRRIAAGTALDSSSSTPGTSCDELWPVVQRERWLEPEGAHVKTP
jgi:hypothetical protein